LNGVTWLIGINAEKLTRVTFMLFAGKAKRDCGAGLYARRSSKKEAECSIPLEGSPLPLPERLRAGRPKPFPGKESFSS
jgi:hypothetical protein